MPQPIIPTPHIPDRFVLPSSRTQKDKNVPRIRTLSLLGSASEMQRDPLGFLTRTQAHGEVVRLRFLFSPAYLISHPESIKHVLQENARNYNKDLLTYKIFKPMLGQGLLINDGQSWLHQRRLIQPAFHRKRLEIYSTLMTDATVAMLERWQARSDIGTPLQMEEEMVRLTLQIVGRALFSLDLSQEASTVGSAVTALLELTAGYVLQPFPPLSVPIPRNRRLQMAIRTLDQVVYRMIAERRRLQTDTGDLLSMLLLAQDEETGRRMNDRQVRDEVQTLLLAGHETTANTLTWTWYLLSDHPEVERRLHAELNDVLGGRVPTVEDLPNLKYTRMVLEEALRLYPAAPLLSRKAVADDELSGCHIPANSMVMISPYAMHRHPAFWEEPERFEPERATVRPSYAYFPFGGGPRMCIGNHFAMMEAQLILSTVAQRYQLCLVSGHPVEPQMRVTLRPRYGLPMVTHARRNIQSQQKN
ncbi:MAG: cytochrome P450 [Ktedonobacteraceae bacterium]|nr:cytochrome P450 [Ktedonobacteraceae bacterium]